MEGRRPYSLNTASCIVHILMGWKAGSKTIETESPLARGAILPIGVILVVHVGGRELYQHLLLV